jgi:two-component system, OmpR family, aerobic respiration control sensor histidine kinase ArcB
MAEEIVHMQNQNQDQSTILDNIVANIPQYIFWKNRDLVYLGCNNDYAQLVGLKDHSQIVGLNDFELPWQTDGNTASYFRQRDIEVLGGKKIINLEQTLSAPGDKKIVVLLNKTPIYNEHQEIIGVLGMSIDISERKRRETELLQSKQEAERAVNVKNQFLHNIQHDIRTPFNGIITAAEILKTNSDASVRDELIDSIIESSNALLKLLNQVVELSHSESGFKPIMEKRLDLNHLINDITATSKLSAQIKGLDLLIDIDPSLPTYLLGDKFRTQCIIMNLLNNAIKFTSTGFVKLSITPIKSHGRSILLQFSVSDSGVGIPLDKYNYIFEKFTRLTPSYEGKHAGLGNGLNIVKRYIEDLQGEIDVESELNNGTTFSCLIPFKKSLIEHDSGH